MKTMCAIIIAMPFCVCSFAAPVAQDFGSNYGAGNPWTTGATGGYGFGSWTITAVQGSGYAGAFIGDPSFGGIYGMSASSFGLYANPLSSGASVDVDRPFSAALQVGETFSFLWGVNWDTDGGNKGFNIYTGGTGGTQLFNVNQAGFPGPITFNGADCNLAYGQTAMVWRIKLTTTSNLQITSTDRNGGTAAAFTTNITVSAAPDAFRWYCSQMGSGDQRQPYFNNLQIDPVPEPTALLTLVAGALGWFACRKH
jgi:hypothetical protein